MTSDNCKTRYPSRRPFKHNLVLFNSGLLQPSGVVVFKLKSTFKLGFLLFLFSIFNIKHDIQIGSSWQQKVEMAIGNMAAHPLLVIWQYEEQESSLQLSPLASFASSNRSSLRYDAPLL